MAKAKKKPRKISAKAHKANLANLRKARAVWRKLPARKHPGGGRTKNPAAALVPAVVLNPVGGYMPKHNPKADNPRRRRRRNPTMNLAAVGWGFLGGSVLGLVRFGLKEATTLPLAAQAGIVAGVGILGGALATMVKPALGAGLVGGGSAIGTAALVDVIATPTAATAGLGAIYSPQLQAPLGAFGAVRSPVGSYVWQG